MTVGSDGLLKPYQEVISIEPEETWNEVLSGYMSLDYEAERRSLVQSLRRQGILRTPEVIRALLAVRREIFVPTSISRSAYDDSALPTLNGQTISAPHMVAIMNEELDLDEGYRLLEVGAGSGYHAAVCAEIVSPSGSRLQGHVFSVEYRPDLVEFARKNLELAGYADRVTVIHGDGSIGYEKEAPFDRILVTAAAPSVPEPLKDQLKIGGSMVIPIGPPFSIQRLNRLDRVSEAHFRTSENGDVVFVPLIGKYAYSERD